MSLEEDKKKELESCLRDIQNLLMGKHNRELYRHIMETVEKPLIEMVLASADGNKKKAAAMLGINRNTLHAKIRKLGIDPDRFKFKY